MAAILLNTAANKIVGKQIINQQASKQVINWIRIESFFSFFYYWHGVACHKRWWQKISEPATKPAKSIYWGYSSLCVK